MSAKVPSGSTSTDKPTKLVVSKKTIIPTIRLSPVLLNGEPIQNTILTQEIVVILSGTEIKIEESLGQYKYP